MLDMSSSHARQALTPIGTPDYPSVRLQAQQSKAQVVGFAVAGAEVTGLLVCVNDIHGLGCKRRRACC